MKYLRRFNESTSGNLDFETFKEIMYDLTDYFDCKFYDHSDEEDNKFYDCWINIPYLDKYSIIDDNPDFNFDYLDYKNDILPPIDSLENIQGIFIDDKVYGAIDDQSDRLEELKNDLDTIIVNNNKIKNVFKTLQEQILPRFDSFNNFLESDIGFDSINCTLRITFEIKDDRTINKQDKLNDNVY